MAAEHGSVAVRALRAALPLYAGQAIVYGAGFAMTAALVWIFREEPAALAHYGVLNQLFQWTCALGVCGLATGLLRLYPARPDDRGDLLATALLSVVAISSTVVLAIEFVPGLAHLLLGDEVAERLVAPYLWKTPAVAVIAVAAAAMHATNSLRGKATIEAGERLAVAVLAIAGALLFTDRLLGLVWGSFAGSVLVGGALRATRRRGRFRGRVFADLFRIGRSHAVFSLLETVRPFVVLRLMNQIGPGKEETGLLVTAMSLTLPLIALPDVLAQALYPAMIGERGEAAGLDRVHRRLFLELLVVTVPALCLMGAAAAWILPMVGSGKYAGAVPAVLAMLPGVAAHGLVAHTGYVVLVRDRLPRAAIASAVTLFAAAAGALWLVPMWGAVGGAVALSAALGLRSVLLLVAARGGRRDEPNPEPGAPNSLDEVRAAADPASFPMQVLAGHPRTVSFFSAAFHGRNDCIHLADAGVTDALLVDIDETKLGQMRALYPPTWRYAAGDAYVVAESLRAAGETFDLVVVDAWQSDAARALDALPVWLRLSRQRVLVTLPRAWLDARGLAAEAGAVETWLRGHGCDVRVASLHFRADWTGGVWWLVVRA